MRGAVAQGEKDSFSAIFITCQNCWPPMLLVVTGHVPNIFSREVFTINTLTLTHYHTNTNTKRNIWLERLHPVRIPPLFHIEEYMSVFCIFSFSIWPFFGHLLNSFWPFLFIFGHFEQVEDQLCLCWCLFYLLVTQFYEKNSIHFELLQGI